MVIRKAIGTDEDSLAGLWRHFMVEEEQAVPNADIVGAAGGWRARLSSAVARGHVLVLEEETKIQGFTVWIDQMDRAWVPPQVAYIVDMYLSPEGRKGFAASRLFRGVLQAVIQERYAEIWTNTYIGNGPVRKLLERVGFQPVNGFEIVGLSDQIYFRRALKQIGTDPI